MSIHELFEQHFAQQHDIPVEDIAGHRMGNGSYSIAIYATSFRYFKAGFEANNGGKLRVLGFLSPAGVLAAGVEKCATFRAMRTDTYFETVYIADCESLKGDL